VASSQIPCYFSLLHQQQQLLRGISGKINERDTVGLLRKTENKYRILD